MNFLTAIAKILLGKESADSIITQSQKHYCDVYKAIDGKWYCNLADELNSEYKDSYTYGPFDNFDEVDNMLKYLGVFKGTYPLDDSGKKEVPKMSPNGQLVVDMLFGSKKLY